MKKLFLLLIFSTALFIMPLTVMAQNFRSGESVVLQKDEIINKDYFAAGNTISLDGTVNGDAYLAGGNIIVNGTINGDLLAAGGNIDIKGTVTGNIRGAGGNVNVSTAISKNASLAGGNIAITSGSNINGNLVLAGGQVTIDSPVGGDVNAAVGQLTLAQNAAIGGDLIYLSGNSALIDQGAEISGTTTQNIPREGRPQEPAKKGAALLSFFTIASFILAAIIGLLLLRFLPVFFEKTTDLIVKKPWLNLGVGFLTIIVFPFIFLLLLITVIGIPIAIVAVIALAIYLYLTKIFVSFVIGKLILERFNKNAAKIWVLLLGLLTYYIVGLIPILGWLFSMIVGLIGLGAILISKKNFYRDFRAKHLL